MDGPPRDLSSPGTSLSREEITRGLLFLHSRVNTGTEKLIEATAFLYGLIEILMEKGLVTVDEVDERKRTVGERLVKQYQRAGNGVLIQDPECDKYTFDKEAEIDCENRLDLCKASCCKLPFALSKQDIREGVVEWDLGQPYIIAQGEDGYCKHLQRSDCHCSVRANRPVPCRAYDCRQDRRIWIDFDRREINPDILKENWPHCVAEAARETAA